MREFRAHPANSGELMRYDNKRASEKSKCKSGENDDKSLEDTGWKYIYISLNEWLNVGARSRRINWPSVKRS